MNARTVQARRIVRDRARALRFKNSLRKGRSIATQLIAGGITDKDTVKGMSTALKGVARRVGMQPVKITRTRNTVDGKGGRMARISGRAGDPARREPKSHVVKHFTTAQVQTLLNSYKPRKEAYKEAKNVLVNA